MNYRILLTYDHRSSPVDASPIARLIPEQVGHLEYVLDSLYDRDDIFNFEKREQSRGILQMSAYSFRFRSQRGHIVRISVSFHESNSHAIDSLHFWAAAGQGRGRGYTLIINDNSTQALLWDSIMPRSHGLPVAHRFINSEIIIGNAYFNFHEQREQHQLHQNATSEFIQLLYDLLTAEG